MSIIKSGSNEDYIPSVSTVSIPRRADETYSDYLTRLKIEASKVKSFGIREVDNDYDSFQPLHMYNEVNTINGELTLIDLINIIRNTYSELKTDIKNVSVIYEGQVGDVMFNINGISTTIDELNNRITTVTTNFSVEIGRILAEVGTSVQDLTGRVDTINSILVNQEGVYISAIKNELDAFNNFISKNYASISVVNNSITSLVGRDEFDELGRIINHQSTIIQQTSESILLKAEKSVVDGLATSLYNSNILITAFGVNLETERNRITELSETYESSKLVFLADSAKLIVYKESLDVLTGRVSTSEGSITVLNNKISLILNQDGSPIAGVIVNAINNNSNVKIFGSRISIDGNTTFTSGYDPSKYSKTFTSNPTVPYRKGDSWIKNGIIFTADVNRLTGIATPQNLIQDWSKHIDYTTVPGDKGSVIYSDDPLTDPRTRWSDALLNHIGDIWYTEYDFGGDIGVKIQPHYFTFISGTTYQWVLDNTVINGGRILAGTIDATKITANSITSDQINVTELQTKLVSAEIAELGGWTVNADSIVSNNENTTLNANGTINLNNNGNINFNRVGVVTSIDVPSITFSYDSANVARISPHTGAVGSGYYADPGINIGIGVETRENISISITGNSLSGILGSKVYINGSYSSRGQSTKALGSNIITIYDISLNTCFSVKGRTSMTLPQPDGSLASVGNFLNGKVIYIINDNIPSGSNGDNYLTVMGVYGGNIDIFPDRVGIFVYAYGKWRGVN